MLTYLSGYIKERRQSAVDISILIFDAQARQMLLLLFLLLLILSTIGRMHQGMFC